MVTIVEVHSGHRLEWGVESRNSVIETEEAMMLTIANPQGLVGTYRRFGLTGPVYRIVSALRTLPDGDHVMKIQVFPSGEEIEYRLSKILEDPREA